MNESTDPTRLEGRIARLERRVMLTALGALAAVVLAAAAVILLVTGTAGQDTASLRGTSFGVLDDTGKVQAALTNDSNGKPGLFVRDADGEQRVALHLSQRDEPALRLADEDGQVRLQASIDDESEAPALVLRDERGRVRLVVGLDEAGQGAIQIRDAGGSVTWQAR